MLWCLFRFFRGQLWRGVVWKQFKYSFRSNTEHGIQLPLETRVEIFLHVPLNEAVVFERVHSEWNSSGIPFCAYKILAVEDKQLFLYPGSEVIDFDGLSQLTIQVIRKALEMAS